MAGQIGRWRPIATTKKAVYPPFDPASFWTFPLVINGVAGQRYYALGSDSLFRPAERNETRFDGNGWRWYRAGKADLRCAVKTGQNTVRLKLATLTAATPRPGARVLARHSLGVVETYFEATAVALEETLIELVFSASAAGVVVVRLEWADFSQTSWVEWRDLEVF